MNSPYIIHWFCVVSVMVNEEQLTKVMRNDSIQWTMWKGCANPKECTLLYRKWNTVRNGNAGELEDWMIWMTTSWDTCGFQTSPEWELERSLVYPCCNCWKKNRPWMLLTNNLYQEIWNKSMTKTSSQCKKNIPEEWGKILTENNFVADPN